MWQSSEDALMQMVVVVLTRLAAGSHKLPGWDNLGTGVQLLLVRRSTLNVLIISHSQNRVFRTPAFPALSVETIKKMREIQLITRSVDYVCIKI